MIEAYCYCDRQSKSVKDICDMHYRVGKTLSATINLWTKNQESDLKGTSRPSPLETKKKKS